MLPAQVDLAVENRRCGEEDLIPQRICCEHFKFTTHLYDDDVVVGGGWIE